MPQWERPPGACSNGSIRPGSIVGRLSVARQQTVEIAKALSFDARIVVMDEPTASLSPTEVEALFRLVRSLQERGSAFVYISHRIEEVMSLSGRITVLTDGGLVGTVATAETTPGSGAGWATLPIPPFDCRPP